MKLSDKLQILKHKKAPGETGPAPERTGIGIAPSTWVLLGLFLILGGVGTLFVFEFFIWTKVPPALVGYWEVNEGPQKGGSYDFFRNGTAEVLVKTRKGEVTYKAQVVVRHKTLVETVKDRETGERATRKSIIRELTADSLILELEKGNVLKMVRIE